MQEFRLKSFDDTEIYCTLWDDVAKRSSSTSTRLLTRFLAWV